jgi:hypothetical protein
MEKTLGGSSDGGDLWQHLELVANAREIERQWQMEK